MTTTTVTTTPADPWPLNGRKQRLVPDETTGELIPYQRVSTFADTLSKKDGLGAWLAWRALLGTQQPDGSRLMQQALHAERTPKKVIDDLAELGGSRVAADTGTRRHQAVAMALTGADMTGMPEDARRELDAIVQLVHGLGRVIAVEQATVCDEYRTAGSCDLILETPDGQPFVLDLKTGAYLDMLSCAIQVGTHARSRYWADGQRGDWVAWKRPRLGIIHAPQDGSAPRLVEIDPDVAKRCCELAVAVRDLRKTVH
jgi:hypothetical protein